MGGEQSSPSRSQSVTEDNNRKDLVYWGGTKQELSRVKGSKYQQRTRIQDNGTKIKAQTYWTNIVDDWGKLSSGRSTWVILSKSNSKVSLTDGQGLIS